MSEETMLVRATLNDDGTSTIIEPDGTTHAPQQLTDWDRVDAMTEEQIWANAMSDPDNPPFDEAELNAEWAAHIRALRESTGLTQISFSDQFRIPLGTLRDWEQGVSRPDSAARAYLQVIERETEAVVRALSPRAAD